MEEMLEVTLAGGRDAPARARFALRGLNGSLAGLGQSVRLLVSELVANAVQHAPAGPEATVQLKLTTSREGVRVEVTDEGAGFEPPSTRTEPLRDGFGLVLLDQLADRWGVTVDRGARVWFELDRSTERGS